MEAALVMPVFALLLFGMIEFGFIFKDSLTLSSMTRSGVRIGAASGNSDNPDTDWQIVSAMLGETTGLSATPNFIIIYKASATSGAMPAACTPPSPGVAPNSQGGLCNVYNQTDLQSIKLMTTWAAAQASGDFSCGTLDKYWCPSTRTVSQSKGPDYLGVYISVQHSSITKFFGSRTLSDSAVMRIEPQTS